VVVKPTKELSHFSVPPPFLFLIHIHQVKMTLKKTEKKRTAIYAGLKPA
jgi:hypothetical protein